MSTLFKVTTINDDIVYIPVEKILYMEVHKKGHTEVWGPRTIFQSIDTHIPIDTLADKFNALNSTSKFIGYTNKSGQRGYVNYAFVAYIKPDKNGNAEIGCGYNRDSRTQIKTQEPLDIIIQRAQSVGVDVLE